MQFTETRKEPTSINAEGNDVWFTFPIVNSTFLIDDPIFEGIQHAIIIITQTDRGVVRWQLEHKFLSKLHLQGNVTVRLVQIADANHCAKPYSKLYDHSEEFPLDNTIRNETVFDGTLDNPIPMMLYIRYINTPKIVETVKRKETIVPFHI